MKPIAHGQGGHASGFRRDPMATEIMRRLATPCIRDIERERELSAQANQPYRGVSELYRGSGDSHSWSNRDLPHVWFARQLAGYWRDRANFYWDLHRSLVSPATTV